MAQYACYKCKTALTIPPRTKPTTRHYSEPRVVLVKCPRCGAENRFTVKQ